MEPGKRHSVTSKAILLCSFFLVGVATLPGCWDDFVWPPGRDDGDLSVDAGVDRSVREGDTVILTADAGNGSEITKYTWEQTAGRPLNQAAWDGLPLAEGESPSLSLQIPWMREGEEGSVELKVTVTDDGGNTASDTVVLTIEQRRFAVFQGVDSSRQGDDGEPFRALYLVELDGGAPAVLHSHQRSEEITRFAVSPTGEYVAFNIQQNDDFKLYIAATDGSGTKLIDQGGYLDQNWRWSPNGAQLAYLAAHTCDCASQMELYIATPGGKEKVTNELATGRTVDALQWAPDGMAIAWSVLNPDTGDRELFVSPAGVGNSTSATSVSTGLPEGGGTISFQWSPYCGTIEISPFGTDRCDGNQIAYMADRDIAGQYELFISPVDGYPSWRISGDLIAEGDVISFQWAPDGRRIAYLATRRYVGVPELFITDNGGNIDNLISRPGSGSTRGGRVEGFGWAPDGERIGYLISQGMAPDTPVELRTALWDGSDNNSVTVDLPSYSNVQEFSWSPTGNHIAYTADISSPGTRDLFVATADGDSKTLISGFTESDESTVTRFSWSPNGTHIALLADSQLPTYNELFTATPDGRVYQISPLDLPMPPDQGKVGDDFKWSADGSDIVYRTMYGNQPSIDQLLIASPDGARNEPIVGPPLEPGSFELR